jgi:hypothetical protein
MNKKLLVGIGISGAIMLGSVYSISANTSGYDLYKSAIKKTHTANSATMSMSFNLEDNEKAIFTMDSLYKGDIKNQVSVISTKLTNESDQSNMEMYKQDGSWFVKKVGTDIVYKMEMNSPHHKNTSELKDDVENLIDVMTKNLQQQITVSDENSGTHTIELDLTGKEIPLTANALSTLMIKHAAMIQDNQDQKGAEFHIKPTLPELDHDISVKQIKLVAKVNKDNYLDQQTIKVVVTGKDNLGKSHELELTMELIISDYNQTEVAPIEIPSENVLKLEMNHGQYRN